jgi:hypothetical protein
MESYTLKSDGDFLEQKCWSLFLKNEFPNYENFWISDIVQLTNRAKDPRDIDFKNDQELRLIGKNEHDICIAQLHYSVLNHLSRAYEIKSAVSITYNMIVEGITRILGAQDVAFELLQRKAFPQKYDPWGDMKGKKARGDWRKSQKEPLEKIRRYRNHLLHGRLTPGIIGFLPILPMIGFEDKYLDWRKISDPANNPGFDPSHYAAADKILEYAWNETVSYFNDSWSKFLLTQISPSNPATSGEGSLEVKLMETDTNAAYYPPII